MGGWFGLMLIVNRNGRGKGKIRKLYKVNRLGGWLELMLIENEMEEVKGKYEVCRR